MGPALYVVGLKKRLVGFEVKGGAGATASLKAHLADSELHIDWCINVNVYAILKVGITDESYLTDFLGGKEVKLNIDIFNEKNATFFNMHIDNFQFKDAVLSFGFKEATGDNLILSTMNVNMDVGQTYLLNVTQVPKGYSLDDIIFTSKEKSIATVDRNGVIKAIGTGCVLIYAETSDHKYKALVSVIVVGESDVNFEELKI